MCQQYPKVDSVKINDSFWTPYLNNIRSITLPFKAPNFISYPITSGVTEVAAKRMLKCLFG